jgi:transcriptional antiterminator RfaH
MIRWYVAQTHAKAEHKALFNLDRQGFTAYLPQYRKRRRHARKTDWIKAPLFPRYIFVAFDPQRARWRSISSTIGIAHLICTSERPLPLPDGVIDDIRARETADGLVDLTEPAPFEKGEAVRVTAGPLAHLIGFFEEMTDSERVTVLLDMLGRPLRVRVRTEQVAAYA